MKVGVRHKVHACKQAAAASHVAWHCCRSYAAIFPTVRQGVSCDTAACLQLHHSLTGNRCSVPLLQVTCSELALQRQKLRAQAWTCSTSKPHCGAGRPHQARGKATSWPKGCSAGCYMLARALVVWQKVKPCSSPMTRCQHPDKLTSSHKLLSAAGESAADGHHSL